MPFAITLTATCSWLYLHPNALPLGLPEPTVHDKAIFSRVFVGCLVAIPLYIFCVSVYLFKKWKSKSQLKKQSSFNPRAAVDSLSPKAKRLLALCAQLKDPLFEARIDSPVLQYLWEKQIVSPVGTTVKSDYTRPFQIDCKIWEHLVSSEHSLSALPETVVKNPAVARFALKLLTDRDYNEDEFTSEVSEFAWYHD